MSRCDEDILIEQYFDIFDKDGNGKITSKELRSVLQVLYRNDLDKQIQEELLQRYDADESGYLDIGEFKKLYHSLKVKPKGASLKEMFSNYDLNDDKSLSKSEVRKFLVDLDPSKDITDAVVDKLMEDTDKDKDGTVSFPEFCRMYVLLESRK